MHPVHKRFLMLILGYVKFGFQSPKVIVPSKIGPRRITAPRSVFFKNEK